MPPRLVPPAQPSGRRLKIVLMATLATAAVVVILGVADRTYQSVDVKKWTAAQAVPTVDVFKPQAVTENQSLVLPGKLQAYYNAPIYARVSGYVHAWFDDIGAHVKAGDVMATIDTPELDQQLIQARADLASAKANMALATTTAGRWAKMLGQDAVSKQETDEKSGDLAAKTAQVGAAQANVDRLLALKDFARITAPFDGVVTARRTDIGALVNAGAGATMSSELFDVAQIDKLRLYVSVPQAYSTGVRAGSVATFTVPEQPGHEFKAVVTSTADAVSNASDALLIELEVDNREGTLQAGDYAQVSLILPASSGTGAALRVPASALVFRRLGMEVAVVGTDHHVTMHPVGIGRDLGQAVEVTSGLKASDQVVDNPPDSIATGDLVQVAKPEAGDVRAAS